MKKVLVTGATGFVGKPLVAYLAKQGFGVTALVRSNDVKVPGARATIILPDIATADWADKLRGIDVIVHLAARVHQMKDDDKNPLAAFMAVNRDATMVLAKAAAEQGVKRFVFLSSVKAAVDGTANEGVDEEVELLPTSFYGRSKLEAEIGLIMLGRQSGLEVVILRPPLIYGPGVKANFQSLIKLVKLGLPLPFAAIDNRRSMLGLNNLLSAIRLAIESPKIVGDAFFLADDAPLSTPQLLVELGVALKKKVRLYPIRMRILREMTELVHQREKFERLAESLVVSSKKFREATGWQTEPMQPELERLILSLYPVKAEAGNGKGKT